MVGLIMATHGNISEELVKSAEMFSGPLDGCRTWSLNPGDNIEEGEKELEAYVEQLDEGDGVLIMTDLFGGTPSNLTLKIAMKRNVGILTGVNLPMLIQFISDRESNTLDQLIADCMEMGRNGILSPSEAMRERRYADG